MAPSKKRKTSASDPTDAAKNKKNKNDSTQKKKKPTKAVRKPVPKPVNHKPPMRADLEMTTEVAACYEVAVALGPDEPKTHSQKMISCANLAIDCCGYDTWDVCLPMSKKEILQLNEKLIENDYKTLDFQINDMGYQGAMRLNVKKVWENFLKTHGKQYHSKLALGEQPSTKPPSWNTVQTLWSQFAKVCRHVWMTNTHLSKKDAADLGLRVISYMIPSENAFHRSFFPRYTRQIRFEMALDALKIFEADHYSGHITSKQNEKSIRAIQGILSHLGLSKGGPPRKVLQRLKDWYISMDEDTFEKSHLVTTVYDERHQDLTSFAWIKELIMDETDEERQKRQEDAQKEERKQKREAKKLLKQGSSTSGGKLMEAESAKNDKSQAKPTDGDTNESVVVDSAAKEAAKQLLVLTHSKPSSKTSSVEDDKLDEITEKTSVTKDPVVTASNVPKSDKDMEPRTILCTNDYREAFESLAIEDNTAEATTIGVEEKAVTSKEDASPKTATKEGNTSITKEKNNNVEEKATASKEDSSPKKAAREENTSIKEKSSNIEDPSTAVMAKEDKEDAKQEETSLSEDKEGAKEGETSPAEDLSAVAKTAAIKSDVSVGGCMLSRLKLIVNGEVLTKEQAIIKVQKNMPAPSPLEMKDLLCFEDMMQVENKVNTVRKKIVSTSSNESKLRVKVPTKIVKKGKTVFSTPPREWSDVKTAEFSAIQTLVNTLSVTYFIKYKPPKRMKAAKMLELARNAAVKCGFINRETIDKKDIEGSIKSWMPPIMADSFLGYMCILEQMLGRSFSMAEVYVHNYKCSRSALETGRFTCEDFSSFVSLLT